MSHTFDTIELPPGDDPLHERLAQAIAAAIEAGELEPSRRLPTHRELARLARVSIGTVTKAIELLSTRGLVRGEVGRGTFVAASSASSSRGGPVDLSLNVPPPLVDEHLLIAASERAARRGLVARSGGLYDFIGTAAQRATVAGWLRRCRLDARPEDMILCVGGQQAIHLAFGDARRVSQTIACESATFSGAIAAAAHLGMSWLPIAHDEEGMLPADLDRRLAETGCRLVYATPVCQNPLGFEVGADRRGEILRVAARHDAYIVEDDVYGVYARKGAPAYKALAPERVYYLNSLSKCLTPLVRLGVLAPPPARLADISRALRAQVFGAPQVALDLGCALIELGALEPAAEFLREEARARTAIARELLALRHVAMPEGAPHIWLPMDPIQAERLARRASEHGIRVTPPDATSTGGPGAGGVRLSILAPERRADLERALRRLAALMADPSETVV